MAKLFRNYNTLTEYEADTNKPVNTVCFIKDAKVIYVDGIQYSYKQLDYLPPAISEAEALEYMGKIINNAKEVGLIYVKPIPTIYWKGDYNIIKINYGNYTAESDSIIMDGVEYYQLKLDKDLDNNFYSFMSNTFTNLIFKDVDTSNVTYMHEMFNSCSSLTSLNLSGFNTSNVTDMGYMFGNCSALTSLDVFKFDTSKVTNMFFMFGGCVALTSLDVSKWDTSNVTNMMVMFSNCSALTSLDMSGWNTSKVTKMNGMFSNCGALTSLDLSGWNTSNVTDMNSMFDGCSALKTIRMVGCSQTTIDKIKTQLSTDGITGCTIVTE